jgi:putative FmdB family regulatory protein
MPTYEYQCQQCGHRFEQFQTITAEPLAECPQCDGRLQRLIGAGAAVISRRGGAGAPLPCGARGSCPSGDGRCMMGGGNG